MDDYIYKLSEISDVPEFEGFAFEDDSSLIGEDYIYDDFRYFDPKRRDWSPPRLAELWKPRAVIGNVQPENDYPTVAGVPAFSQRAVDALKDLLEANGELLPVVVRAGLGPYYAYNITTVADIVDTKRSTIRSLTGGYAAYKIEHYEVFADRIRALSIFKIPERPSDTYVTEVFADRVRRHGLRGLHLMKVWPLPPGTDWYRAAMQELWQQLRTGAIKTKAGVKPLDARSMQATEITGRPLESGEEADSLARSVNQHGKRLGIDPAKMSVDQIQEWIFKEVGQLHASSLAKDDKLDRAFWLGIAWGDSIVRHAKWEWVMLEDSKKRKTLGIASPNRSHAIAALQYVEKIAMDANADVTSQLLFNLIRTGQLPIARPGEFKLLN